MQQPKVPRHSQMQCSVSGLSYGETYLKTNNTRASQTSLRMHSLGKEYIVLLVNDLDENTF